MAKDILILLGVYFIFHSLCTCVCTQQWRENLSCWQILNMTWTVTPSSSSPCRGRWTSWQDAWARQHLLFSKHSQRPTKLSRCCRDAETSSTEPPLPHMSKKKWYSVLQREKVITLRSSTVWWLKRQSETENEGWNWQMFNETNCHSLCVFK